jgi:hypothetical protein
VQLKRHVREFISCLTPKARYLTYPLRTLDGAVAAPALHLLISDTERLIVSIFLDWFRGSSKTFKLTPFRCDLGEIDVANALTPASRFSSSRASQQSRNRPLTNTIELIGEPKA